MVTGFMHSSTLSGGIILLVLALSLVLSGCEKEGKDKVSLPEGPVTATARSAEPEAATPKKEDEATVPAARVPFASAEEIFTGRTESHRKATITPRMPGIITQMHVREGDIVEEGQLLVSYDTSNYELGVKMAKAGLEVAEAQRTALKTEWKRLKNLSEKGAVPESQFEQLDGQMKVAKAGIGQAKVGVRQAKKSLADATTVAPFRSVVTMKMASEGVNAAAFPPTPLVQLEEIDPLDVRVDMPETMLKEANLGLCLELRFPSMDEVRYARVEQKIPSVNPMSRTFPVIAQLPNADHAIPPGLFVKASLVDDAKCGEVAQ